MKKGSNENYYYEQCSTTYFKLKNFTSLKILRNKVLKFRSKLILNTEKDAKKPLNKTSFFIGLTYVYKK